MIAYHFVGSTLRDGRPVPADGEWLVHDGPVELCKSGLHASRRPWHALQFAPGETLCLVDLDEIVAEEGNKLVARRRRIVWRVDLTADLRAFALQCARDVLHLWDAPDIVRQYLATGDEKLREAAWDAADEVTWDACAVDWVVESAASAARAAAGVSAREAARGAAWEAVTAAARAVRDDMWDATWEAAWTAQGKRFDALCLERLGVTEEY